MVTPKKVRVREEAEGLVLTYYWRDWAFIFVFLIGLAIGPGLVLLILSVADGPPPVFWLFTLPFVATGLSLAYWSLGRVINRTEIRVQQGQLRVRQKPLPWRHNANLAVGEIESVGQETYYNRDKYGSFRNERLSATTRDGKKHILIPKMELAAAEFLAQEIEARLGMRQALTEGERAASLQAAKQEQKRVEAGQAKVVMPLLIIMIPLLLIGGIWLLVSTYMDQREARASLNWPSMEARADDYRFDTTTEEDAGGWSSTTYYHPVVIFKYVVDGKAYKIEKGIGGSSEYRSQAQEQFSQYPLGTAITIYYNPNRPSQARFSQSAGDPTGAYIGVVVILALIPMCALLLVYGAREVCKAEGCPDAWKHWEYWLRQVPFLGRAAG